MTVSKYQTTSGTRWKYRFKAGGINHRAQGFLTQQKAKKAEASARLTTRQTATPCLLEAANLYLDYVGRNQHKKTYEQKKSHLKKFISFAGNIQADQLTPHTCQKFLDQFPNTTSNTHRKTLSACFKWLIDMQVLSMVNPLHMVKHKPREPFIKYIPPKEHIFQVMLLANPIHRDFIRTIYYSLARRGEIVNLLTDDVDLKRNVLTLHTRKRTGEIRARRVRMVQPLIDILAPRCQEGNKYVFTNPKTGSKYFDMNTVLPRLCKRAKIKPFTFHAIRHYGASYLASIGTPAKEIQHILGHSELRTTEIYLHDLEDVAEVSNKLEIDPLVKNNRVNIGVNVNGKLLKL